MRNSRSLKIHASEVRIATVSDRWKTLYMEQGRGQPWLPGGSLFWSCKWGLLVIASSPQRPVIADFGPPNLQMRIEAL
jgi:hypothetical protein